MIDTNKYEGHTPTEEWGDIVYAHGYLPIFLDDDVCATDIDRRLMADAPRILDALHATHTWIEYTLLRLENREITMNQLIELMLDMCNSPEHKAIVDEGEEE